jgi:hypothetical protein
MRELRRVLRPGGWATLLVPIDLDRATTVEDSSISNPQERSRLFGQEDHFRLYGRDFVSRLEEAGFTVRWENYLDELDAQTIQQYVLSSDGGPIFFCRKR